MKEVEDKLELPPLKPELRKFVDWVAGYTLSPRGMVLRMALRMGEHLGSRARARGRATRRPGAATHDRGARPRAGAAGRRPGARQERGRATRPASRPGVIDGLVDEGTLETVVLPPEPVARAPDPDFAQPDFAPAQRQAADALRATVAKGGYAVTLLDGVTGSGKTQVYFEAVSETIRRGRQALVLMPEIALDHAVPRSLRRALRGAAGGVAFAALASACGRAPGARSRPATSRSWPAPARRCSCRMRISA